METRRDDDRSFWLLMGVQFLAAFNDNVFQIILALLLARWSDPERGRDLVNLSGAVFAAPFLLFSLGAGRLADRWSKRRVVVLTKVLDVPVVVFILAGIYRQNTWAALGGLFLLAAQSAFFSPAKYGLLPELQSENRLSRANGLLNAATFIAILTGTIAGSLLGGHLALAAALTLLMALGSLAGAFAMRPVPAANPDQPLSWNPIPDLFANWRLIRGDRALKLSVWAVTYFWFVGGVFHLNMLIYPTQVMRLPDKYAGLLLGAIVVGIALGSYLAGTMSHGQVEMGFVPLGAVGMSLFTLDLFFSHGSLVRTALDSFLLGACGGLFVIPLNTTIQLRSPAGARGRVLATVNFLSFVAILLASGFLWAMAKLGAGPDAVFLILGLLSLAATAVIVAYRPQALARLGLYLLTHTFYRLKVVGRENVPLKGPALLVSNHVSMADPFLIGAALPRLVRFLMYRGFYENKFIHPFARFMEAIPVSNQDPPKRILRSLLEARDKLKAGRLVGIFAEGAITRSAQMLAFHKGMEAIMKGVEAPVIPVHLDRVWGSIFSFERGGFIWKVPRWVPYPVTVSFGTPLPAGATSDQVRQAVLDLGAQAFEKRLTDLRPLHRAFLRTAKGQWFTPALTDSTGPALNFGKAATGTLLLARRFRKLFAGETQVGVLLPPGVGGALANTALLYAGKAPVNLNYSLGRSVIDGICRDAGVARILTARKMLEALKWGEDPRAVFLEELPRAPKPVALAAFALAGLLPSAVVEKIFVPWDTSTVQDLAALLFTSGSTGAPKGVMLTHANVQANIQGLQETYQLRATDVIVGVLPFFHSFGFTGTLWLPLLAGCGVAYHRSPLEPLAIKKLIKDLKGTVLLATPTFLQMWMRKFSREDVATLRFVLTGAEKLHLPFAKEFTEALGVPVLEGYGCTELSPAACVSVLDVTQGTERQVGYKPGKVGRPLPGVSVRVVDPDTGAPRPVGENGLLLIKGPNVMRGYWNQPERTAEVVKDGWYVTGDIARVDEDGFVEITDRLSRFSKIGGEMVPHMLVEETMGELSGEPEARFLVLSFPDEKRGEKLVVLHNNLAQSVEELIRKLEASAMPKLWVPDRRCFFAVAEWPTLGSGKVDMVKAKELARQAMG
jgi:acyl-[acyl-carrier-protein]-phospholipid O-acyltransferase/long-chain-fatty-acid--[acyl-carrier-protein] ligase